MAGRRRRERQAAGAWRAWDAPEVSAHQLDPCHRGCFAKLKQIGWNAQRKAERSPPLSAATSSLTLVNLASLPQGREGASLINLSAAPLSPCGRDTRLALRTQSVVAVERG